MTPTLLEVASEWAERENLSIRYDELNLEQADHSAISEQFDMLVLHNVLEYVSDAESVIHQLKHWIRPGGTFSLVMHNIDSKVLKSFFWNEDPAEALHKLGSTESFAVTLNTSVKHYPLEQMLTWLDAAGFELVTHYGIRCLYDYKHTDKKFDPQWHEHALELEKAICERSPFRDIGTMRHLILRKK